MSNITNEAQSNVSTYLSGDEEVYFAFQDILNLPSGLFDKLSSSSTYNRMKDFAHERQNVYKSMLKMMDSMRRYEEMLDKQKAQLASLEAQAAREPDNTEAVAQIKSLSSTILVSERSLVGFKNIYARDYQMGYENLIAQGVSEAGLSHAIEGLEKLNEKITASQVQIDKYISSDGIHLEKFSVKFRGDRTFEVNIATDFVGAVDGLTNNLDGLRTVDRLLDSASNLAAFCTDAVHDGLLNSKAIAKIKSLKKEDWSETKEAIKLFLKKASPLSLIEIDSPEAEIMSNEAKMLFERDDWQDFQANMRHKFNIERDIFTGAESDLAWYEVEWDAQRLQRYLVDLGIILGMIKLGLHKAQGQSDASEKEYTKRLIQLSTLKSEHVTLGAKLNRQTLAEQIETDRARFDYLESRLPTREQQLQQMDLKYERTQLTTLKNLFDSVYAEYRTYRNEGWDNPEGMIGRLSWPGGAISEMYSRCKNLLYDVHYLTCSFKSQGQHVDELEPKPSDVANLQAQSEAVDERIDDVLESEGLKEKVKHHLSAMKDNLEMSIEMGNKYAAKNERQQMAGAIEKINHSLSNENVNDIIKKAEKITANIRTIDFQINDVKNNSDADIQPFFASYIHDAEVIVNYADDLVLNFVIQNTDGKALLKTLNQKENDIQSIHMSSTKVRDHYSSKTAKEFRAELSVVKDMFREAEQSLKELDNYFFDPEETESLRRSVLEQNKRLEQLIVLSRNDISEAFNTLSKKWFGRSVKGKIEPLCEEIKSKSLQAKKDYETPFGTDKKSFQVFRHGEIRVTIADEDVSDKKYPFQYFDHVAAKNAITQLNEGDRWYKPNPHKAQIKKLESFISSNPNIHPEILEQEVNDRIASPASKQIKSVKDGNEPNEVKTVAIGAILEKVDGDINRFLQEQTVKSRVLQSTANKVIAKQIVEGIRIATDLSLAITRLVISVGADIMAWAKLISAFIKLVQYVIKLLTDYMNWLKKLSVELIKLHDKMTNDLQEGIRGWLRNAQNSALMNLATLAPGNLSPVLGPDSMASGIPIGTLFAGTKFLATVNGSLATTRVIYQNTQAALNGTLSTFASQRLEIGNFLQKVDAQKEALQNSSRKDKGDFIMKLATAEEKLFELLEKTANLSAKVALGRGLTDKAATDIAMYENFLNRSYLPTSISEDPDSVVAHLMENLRFGQSVYDSSVIISTGDFKDFGDLLESIGGIFV